MWRLTTRNGRKRLAGCNAGSSTSRIYWKLGRNNLEESICCPATAGLFYYAVRIIALMSEANEQMAVVDYCDARRIPCFHIPNGGRRSPREAANLKRQGVKAGVPDLCIPVARAGYHSLWIEMKAKGGKVSAPQRQWLETLRAEGHCAYVCYGADSAISLVESYMDEKI